LEDLALRTAEYCGPKVVNFFRDHYFTGLRKVGVPQELPRPAGLQRSLTPMWADCLFQVSGNGSAIGRKRQLHPRELTAQRLYQSFDQCQQW
jgi:hypothetical protein